MAESSGVIVVDLGCAEIGSEESVVPLIERFQPDVLFGFDPNVAGGIECVQGTLVIRSPLAAWTRNGRVRFVYDATRSRVLNGPLHPGDEARCFDLNAWLHTLPPDEPTILKMDVEGAEYTLLPHLARDLSLDLVLVEWHDEPLRGMAWLNIKEWT